MGTLKKWIPLLIIAIALIGFFLSDLPEYFTLQSLKAHEKQLMLFISSHPILSPFIYIALYALTVIFLLPVGVFLSIAGGFFFAHPLSEIYILIASTLGACIVFLLAKGPCRDLFLKKAGHRLKKLEKNFKKNDASFLLFLRVIPLSPFWLVNMGCAFLGVRLWTLAWTTIVGNIPSTVINSEIGTKLGTIFRSGQEYTITNIFNWRMLFLMLALALLIVLPVLFKKKTN
jgi:uncharacterized membrane protein YdjX (TVP38/TMEM64 family)